MGDDFARRMDTCQSTTGPWIAPDASGVSSNQARVNVNGLSSKAGVFPFIVGFTTRTDEKLG